MPEKNESFCQIDAAYSKTLAETVAASGNACVENLNAQNFPHDMTRANESVEIGTVHLDRKVTTQEVLAELDRLGFRSANLLEALALSKKNPDLQSKFPLVVIGSSWEDKEGKVRFPVFEEDQDGRGVNLFHKAPGEQWAVHHRFLVVRK